MKSTINTAEIIKEIKTSDFLLSCRLPLVYVSVYQIFQIKNDRLCMLIPYLKYKTTGVVDKTLVYPIRYTLTVSLPDKRFIGFEDLAFNPVFGKVDFNKPIGLFRHDSIKNLNKNEYSAKKIELFSMYDKIASAVLGAADCSDEDAERFSQLLGTLLEPSLKPIYKVLDADFYASYISGGAI